MRFAAIGAVLAGIIGLFLYAGGWLTPHRLSPASMINTFEKVNGLHPGVRRNHAMGVCISGYFDSNGRGVALSKAAIFPPGRVSVIGRFSLAGGRPYVADAPHTVRGMAILSQRCLDRRNRKMNTPKPRTQFALQSRILHWLMAAMLLAMLFIGVTMVASLGCAAPRFFVGTGQVQRRIISWELARGVRGNLTREEL